MAVAVEKYHGTGNDFLVCEADASVPDWGEFAIAHCDRETGATIGDRRGADGVLVLSIEGERVRMRLYQPDGGTAAMCGNGARCAAQWAARRLGTDEFVIDTPAGERRARVGEDTIAIEMGVPSFAPSDVPLAREEPLIREDVEGWEVTAVNTGVPHAVVFVDEVAEIDLAAMAPSIRHAERFPEGANVNLAAARDGGFDGRTFERGVEGETRSCGTGAVAIAAVAKRLGLTDGEQVRVSPPGGELLVDVPDEGPATLSGPVEFEGRGEVPAP
ncbi:diaminopimelate epimerase [Halalkalicoccus subterraneus]|uniref:diaminopimelate epimerase n=1 Tax=Halalkalicoccus subterraneus TaxID=2675002 RepID=UPI000EFC6E20|nr:diaminopimelate epimerase [Halalkalicoccus subterraneus]